MSNTKHTPGPWQVVDSPTPAITEIKGPSFRIMYVWHAIDVTEEQTRQRNADARLIAAAPDGLAANIKARDAILDVLGTGMIGSDGLIAATLRDAMQACNAAIAKATND
jgi:hypothetical protein